MILLFSKRYMLLCLNLYTPQLFVNHKDFLQHPGEGSKEIPLDTIQHPIEYVLVHFQCFPK